MITANPDVNIAQFVTAFNQLVDIHIVNILAMLNEKALPRGGAFLLLEL